MTRRSPARLLAPAALVASAVALFIVLASGGGSPDPPSSATQPEATATATAEGDRPRRKGAPGGDTYTVEPGDTPSGIAAKLDIDPDELLAANPEIDATALTVGEELVLP